MNPSLPLLCGATLFGALLARPAQAQLSCANALPVGVGLHTAPAVTGDAPPTCMGGQANNGLWYSFFSADAQALTVSTSLVQNQGLDTRLHVYGGNCGQLICLGSDDDGGSGWLSILTVSLEAGNTYYIAFDNYWSSVGFDFQLSVSQGPPPGMEFPVFAPVTLTTGNPLGIVDMNNDGLDDLVIPASTFVRIYYQLPDGTFNDQTIPTPQATHMPSWSMCVGDLNADGHNDLMYGGGSGVSLMLSNSTGTGFTQQVSPFYIFSQRTNMVDLNNDGHLDAFVCHDVDANVYVLNNGVGGLNFIQGGMGSTCGNYGSLFTDVNNNGLMDCFVAKCGCDPVNLMLINNGNLTWTNTAAANDMAGNHQSWSSAWGDFDNDGDMDVLIGSSSGGPHRLLRNDGNGNFTNVTVGSGMDLHTGTSIEWTTHDFNNDGFLDIMGGGRIMMGHGDMTFTMRPGSLSNGPIGDINNDGFLDYMNNTLAYYNTPNANHWLKVVTVGTVSNGNGIGARVEVTSALGTQIREIRSGDGFRFMSSMTAHFGLGADDVVDQVTVYWPSGIVQHVFEPGIDQTITIVEGNTTGVTEATVDAELELFPNPARQWLDWKAPKGMEQAHVRIFDASGQLVHEGRAMRSPMDVGHFKAGVYLFQLVTPERTLQQRFVKE